MKFIITLVFILSMNFSYAYAQNIPEYTAQLLEKYSAFDARQGVAVDQYHFYAVDNYGITKHTKQTGEALVQWDGLEEGHILIHLDSAVVLNEKLYASHSNYGQWPMTSSVEVWDTSTLTHISTYSFGVNRGSLTWLDRSGEYWWGAFANYDKIQNGDTKPYGQTINTQIVKMDNGFQVVQSWILPQHILDRMNPMSNSGGTWGEDGYLYLTGHDHGELYVMEIPMAGSILHHAATVKVPDALQGQGIAWDRTTGDRTLWGISKSKREVYKVRIPVIENPAPMPQPVIRTGNFNKN